MCITLRASRIRQLFVLYFWALQRKIARGTWFGRTQPSQSSASCDPRADAEDEKYDSSASTPSSRRGYKGNASKKQ